MILVTNRQYPEKPWHWSRMNEHGSLVESSFAGEGYATLREMIDYVEATYPDDEIVGIGADEPEKPKDWKARPAARKAPRRK